MPSKHISGSANTSNSLFNCPHAVKTHFTQCQHLKPPFQLPPCPQNTFHTVPTPQTLFSTVCLETIEPSDSEWASHAFLVPKKEKGEWRLVVDYRGWNEQTEHDSYPLPLIDTILQKQQKKRIFTVLDPKHGYHQMPLHPDSRPCTAMSTPLTPRKRCLWVPRMATLLSSA